MARLSNVSKVNDFETSAENRREMRIEIEISIRLLTQVDGFKLVGSVFQTLAVLSVQTLNALLTAFFNVINWAEVARLFELAK